MKRAFIAVVLMVAMSIPGCNDLEVPSAPVEIRRAVQLVSDEQILAWPLRVDDQYTARVGSVFDHSMQRPYKDDGTIVAATGLTALREAGSTGGKGPCYLTTNGSTTSLQAAFNYVGPSSCPSDYLSYDDHPGFDYSYCVGT